MMGYELWVDECRVQNSKFRVQSWGKANSGLDMACFSREKYKWLIEKLKLSAEKRNVGAAEQISSGENTKWSA